MWTRRAMMLGATGLGAAGLLTATLLARPQATNTGEGSMPRGKMGPATSKMSRAEKIANAISSAPAAVSARATVLDWPANETAAPETLRPGTNGWTCFPDMPETKGNDPMCVDDVWMKWIEAYMSHKTPAITRVGIGYMTASGGGWGSNTDPYAMAEAPGNAWGHHPPHLMILVPDTKSLSGISTDPANGGPYVMFAGTPYAHIMAPTTGEAMHH